LLLVKNKLRAQVEKYYVLLASMISKILEEMFLQSYQLKWKKK